MGEAWSVIAGKGQAFEDQENPQVVVKVGEEGSQGVTEITDIIFSTVGPSSSPLWFISSHTNPILTSPWCNRCGVEC